MLTYLGNCLRGMRYCQWQWRPNCSGQLHLQRQSETKLRIRTSWVHRRKSCYKPDRKGQEKKWALGPHASCCPIRHSFPKATDRESVHRRQNIEFSLATSPLHCQTCELQTWDTKANCRLKYRKFRKRFKIRINLLVGFIAGLNNKATSPGRRG